MGADPPFRRSLVSRFFRQASAHYFRPLNKKTAVGSFTLLIFSYLLTINTALFSSALGVLSVSANGVGPYKLKLISAVSEVEDLEDGRSRRSS
jgi:hypothetical protein